MIGGYTLGGKPFDALVFGYYEGDDLVYAARTRNGFTRAAWPLDMIEITRDGMTERQYLKLDELRGAPAELAQTPDARR